MTRFLDCGISALKLEFHPLVSDLEPEAKRGILLVV